MYVHIEIRMVSQMACSAGQLGHIMAIVWTRILMLRINNFLAVGVPIFISNLLKWHPSVINLISRISIYRQTIHDGCVSLVLHQFT